MKNFLKLFTKTKPRKIIFSLILVALLVLLFKNCKKVEPVLEVLPTELDFGKLATERELVIQNVGKTEGFLKRGVKTLEYSINVDEQYEWISVQPEIGQSDDESDTVIVSINRNNLLQGDNTGEITILSNGGKKTVPIFSERKFEKIKISTPLPGSHLPIGHRVDITWSVTSGVSDIVNIFLYENGTNVGTIASNYNYQDENNTSGKYTWMIDRSAFAEGNDYTIRIEDARRKDVFGELFPINIINSISALHIKNISTDHQSPNKSQFIFSVRDQNDHAVIINPYDIDWNDLKVYENKEEIDYLESHAFLFTQNDFELQVMLVLDFSESMYDDTTDINAIISGAKLLINNLGETHQVGVIEFHRPDKQPNIIHPFTTYKQAVVNSIDMFVADKIYRDFSTCWDAVKKGLEQFPTKPDPNIFKTIVLVSDGFDNSSVCKPRELVSIANDRDVHIFTMGVGQVHEEMILKGIAIKTGGTYTLAENLNVLSDRFKQVIRDLLGQYKISYITPKKPEDGPFNVNIDFSYEGISASPALTDKIDPLTIFGNTIKGIIKFSTPPMIEDNRAEIFMWCEHVPRYINEFRFRLTTDKPYKILLTKSHEGGICDGWSINKGEDGWYTIASSNQGDPHYDLEFGNFGTICKIIVDDIEGDGLIIPFELDNSFYDMGQSFFGGKESEIDNQGNWTTNINVGSFLSN